MHQPALSRSHLPSHERNIFILDQFLPALDFDGTGEMMIVYYSRQVDCPGSGDTLYDPYYVRVNGAGTPYDVQNPAKATPPGTQSSNALYNTPTRSIGDYQEIFCTSSVCYSAWISAYGSRNEGDVELTTYQ